MRNRRVVLNTLILLLGCTLTGWSQDAAKPTAKSAAAEKATEKKSVNRLPSNYGKLGLTDAQKDKVYAINDKYDSQLDALEDQLKALRAKRGSETEAVLNAEQKKLYMSEIEKITLPFTTKSDESYKLAIERGMDLQIYNEAYANSFRKMSKRYPQKYYASGEVPNDSQVIDWAGDK